MTQLTLVAALGRNRVIGADGDIPWRLPGEQAQFKALTMGHTLIMGRATFDSIGRVLPGRRSIVLTRDRSWRHPEVEVAHSLPEALGLAGPTGEVFVIGGGQVYAEAMPFAHRMVLTLVPAEPDGDTFFPEWDEAAWDETERLRTEQYDVVTYERR